MLVTIGADSHKASHTVVAVDQVGRVLGEKQVRATSEGHLLLVQWAARFDHVVFALEDCRHLTRRLEADLLKAGHAVVRVPTRLMAQARRSAREPGVAFSYVAVWMLASVALAPKLRGRSGE